MKRVEKPKNKTPQATDKPPATSPPPAKRAKVTPTIVTTITKKEAERATVPMNVSGSFSELEQFLPHIEALSVPHEMAVPIIKRIFPNGVPQSAVPAVNNMFGVINVLGPVPASINPIFTMAMGGFNANDAGAAQHALSLDFIAQLSAAMRAKTPHVQHNRIRFDASIAELKAVVQTHLAPQFEGVDTAAADAILTQLEKNIVRNQNPYDESRNLGLFVPGVGFPECKVRLPEFTLNDILRNLALSKSENDDDACVWGKMCTALTHGSQLTFRTRNVKRVPLKRWTVDGDATVNNHGACLLCEVVHVNGFVRWYQEKCRAPPRVLQKFKIVCDSEVGLPADALLFADPAFNGLIAPFIKADWLFAHLVAPPEDSDEPYRVLRGYFAKR